MGRSRYALVAVVAFIAIVGGWALFRTNASDTSDPAAPAAPAVGVPTCSLTSLPPEAADTVRFIHAGGPFPFPRNDGVVFGNREGHLPDQTTGYYHEYTVITPGAKNRSTRRIITGGTPPTHPPQYFYTADHYDSFCLIPDAERQR
jgi:guanyl-specific ribonuclease Sa